MFWMQTYVLTKSNREVLMWQQFRQLGYSYCLIVKKRGHKGSFRSYFKVSLKWDDVYRITRNDVVSVTVFLKDRNNSRSHPTNVF